MHDIMSLPVRALLHNMVDVHDVGRIARIHFMFNYTLWEDCTVMLNTVDIAARLALPAPALLHGYFSCQ